MRYSLHHLDRLLNALKTGLCPIWFSAATVKFGLPFMAKMYLVPYWINVMWLDLVTYLHHTDKRVRVLVTN